MCGIAGMIDLSADRRPAPDGVVPRMAAAILHRGPDEDGFLRRPGFHLANRRLSIVGLADGRQPIANEAETAWTVFNGELFDYPEVRGRLETAGHRFRTHTDTELVPHLWDEFGEKMFDHLRGQFAFCLWDARTNEFVLARDRNGICPLFFAAVQHDGTDWLLFASEIKAILASGLVPAKPDPDGLNHFFTFFGQPGPPTMFAGVSALMPGHYLRFAPGAGTRETQLRQRPHWEVSYPDAGHEDYGGDEKRIIDGYEEVLYAAVKRRLRADVPVVSYLSGGVDSSLVVAMANKALGRAIPTFTISVKSKGMNEEPEALAVAKHLGCEPVVVDCSPEDVRAGYPELIAAAEFPVMDTSCVALMNLAKAVHARGFKVALTGEGPDEWLAGYPWFKVHRALSAFGVGAGLDIRRAVLRAVAHPGFEEPAATRTRTRVGGHNGWLDLYEMIGVNKIRFFSDATKAALGARSAYDDLAVPAALGRWHPFHRGLYLGARVMLAGHQLTCKGDRIAMHSSVETRYPFLDEDVLDYTAKLHPRWKLRGLLGDKYVERKVAERWLPRDVAWRRKKMFRAPTDSFRLGKPGGDPGAPAGRDRGSSAGTGWVEEVLSPDAIRAAGYFDADAVTAARTKVSGMRPLSKLAMEMGLTAVAATQLWHRLYIAGG